MATNDPKVVQEVLKSISAGYTGREVIFQPDTGEILVARAGERPSPDAVRATQMAEEGFF